ncbi:hypothetical protein C1J03_10580 [Sulfitobacter sp. SK012]|uniref:hypothetical protein n=1 Tax=Sulfitobacter sp. SK012 TaxID=1389005 RepID=UPI000E0A9D92|nr:hypothetical protein [Sulfitobacter sp. SK012]AXI46432.1 hypothetical protein C1J03_10580 [Sulfitobacter sp. SK012]
MRSVLRPVLGLCVALTALSACDPAEFDSDPQVRADARAGRKCVQAVTQQTGDASGVVNTTLPIVEINQLIIDLPSSQTRWVCLTDDLGAPLQLYQLGAG